MGFRPSEWAWTVLGVPLRPAANVCHTLSSYHQTILCQGHRWRQWHSEKVYIVMTVLVEPGNEGVVCMVYVWACVHINTHTCSHTHFLHSHLHLPRTRLISFYWHVGGKSLVALGGSNCWLPRTQALSSTGKSQGMRLHSHIDIHTMLTYTTRTFTFT